MKFEIEPTKTYKTKDNAVKAVEKFEMYKELRYFIMTSDDGRFFPVFVGQKALQHFVHINFNVIA